MNKTLKHILIGATAVAFTACGGGGSTPADTTTTTSGGTTTGGNTNGGTAPATFGNNTVGILQFGLIKNGIVEIFAMSPSGKIGSKPLFTETTTDGDINHAGRFNTHSSELEDKTYYLYQYKTRKGTDIDANLDGIEDKENTILTYDGWHQTIKVLIRGEWIKKLEDKAFRITPLSFAITSSVDYEDKPTAGLKDKFHNMSKQYILTDISGDGNIDIIDALIYNPLTNLKDTADEYRDVIHKSQLAMYKNLIHSSVEEYSYSKQIGAIAIGCYEYGHSALRDDDLAMVEGKEALTFVDISDPSDMSILTRIEQRLELMVFSKSSNNIVYALEKTTDSVPYSRALKVIDISDAESPNIIFEEDPEGQYILDYRFSADMQQLYLVKILSNNKTYFEIYDLSDEKKPNKLSSTLVNKDTFGIYLSDKKDKIYLAREDSDDDSITYIESFDIRDFKILKSGTPVKYIDLISGLQERISNKTKDNKTLFTCVGTILKAFTKSN